MKKFLIALLALSLLLSACKSKNNNNDNTESSNSAPETTETTSESNTLGDDNGYGTIDEPNDGGNNNTNDGEANFDIVDKVESADDAVNFIAGNVYSKCKDVLPMYTETVVLSKDDMDSITYNTGLTDISGINDIIISESGIGSFAYSFVMLRTDGTNTADIQTALGNSINPNKWICVSADKVASVMLDNDIILVMGKVEQVDTIMTAVTEAAAGVYNNVGSVVNVLG
ncbi:MAG: hypothetical protein ACI4XJ_11155 [Eubacteriales bacterium]